MVQVNVFVIRDEALKAFNSPVYFPTVDAARRSFGDAVAKDEGFRSHPADYSLFHIGTYNDETARIEQFAIPVRIATATDYVQPIMEKPANDQRS